jgi:uncharacterized OB-fold protein
MAEYVKPVPTIDGDTEKFWEGCKAHELRLPRCKACNHLFYPPQAMCPRCLSGDLDYTKVSGKGKVYSFTVVHQNGSRGFKEETPYVMAYITLEEGVQMLTNIIGSDPATVKVDLPVEVTFEDITEEISLPKFKLAK